MLVLNFTYIKTASSINLTVTCHLWKSTEYCFHLALQQAAKPHEYWIVLEITAHLLFLKVSTVWNGRISLLKAAPLHTNWGFRLHFLFCPGARATPPRVLNSERVVLRLQLPPPHLNPVGGSHSEGAVWFRWGIIIQILACKETTGWATYWTISPSSGHFILTLNLM